MLKESLLAFTITNRADAYNFALKLGEVCQEMDFTKANLTIRVRQVNAPQKKSLKKGDAETNDLPLRIVS